MSDSKIDLKHLSAACYEHFMRDQPPYPPDVKTLQDLSAFLRYKSLCLIDGEEPDPDVVDNNAFVGQLQHVSHSSLFLLFFYYPPDAYINHRLLLFHRLLISWAGRRRGGWWRWGHQHQVLRDWAGWCWQRDQQQYKLSSWHICIWDTLASFRIPVRRTKALVWLYCTQLTCIPFYHFTEIKIDVFP